MDKNFKLLSGVAVRLLFDKSTMTKIREVMASTQTPTQSLANIVATVFREAIAKAQQAGAKLDNQVVMKSLMVLVKEVVGIVGGEKGLPAEKEKALSEGLLAMSLKSLKDMTSIPEGATGPAPGQPPMQSGMQPGMQPAPQGQPMPQQGGMIMGAMGGM